MGYDERIINLGPLRFNPGVSLVSFAILWGVAIWCMTEEKASKAELLLWQNTTTYWFTWLYIGSQDVWIVFSIYIYFKYGHKKMCAEGKEKDKPEFSDASYFMMLFTCGVAVGMFFFGVNEPTYYYSTFQSRYSADPGMTGSEKAQWAVTLTVFHWGLHGWVPYCIVGLTLGFACYRQGKPLTMRSTLYPLLGDRINGWMGDSVDIVSIVVVVAGVCTSLGLGTQQIAEGINRLDKDIFDISDTDETRNAWVVIIVCITVVACVSVVSGIDRGIKYTATTAFLLANFVGLMVFLLDDPVYFLDIIVQTCGHYLQNIIELGFQTDAFQRQKQHGTVGGEYTDAVNKPNYIFPGAPLDAYNETEIRGGSPYMMQYWTIFYWGWWIAWSPFVGMFIARISKGRTVREVFNYSMTAPLLYVIIWFSIFGGAGIKMANTALECKKQETLGLNGGAGTSFADEYSKAVCCQINTEHGRTGWEILEVTGDYDKTAFPNGIVNASMCEYLRPGMSRTSLTNPSQLASNTNMTNAQKNFVTSSNFKVTNNDARRTVYEFKNNGPANFFEVLEQYYGWGDFLTGVTIVTIILYFVTSSDSGSFVVDLISAGGNRDRHGNERDPHWLQRVVWSLTEGGLAIGLMYSGGKDATKALQAMSISVGLPFTIVLCLMIPSLLRMLEMEDGTAKMSDYEWKLPAFGGVFDGIDFIFSFGGTLGGCPSRGNFVSHTVEFVIGFLPFIHANKTLNALDVDGKSKVETMAYTIILAGLWITWVVSLIIEDHHQPGWFAFAICVYTAIAVVLTIIRGRVRETAGIKGSILEDFLVCFIMYPQAGAQCWIQVGGGGGGSNQTCPVDKPSKATVADTITSVTAI